MLSERVPFGYRQQHLFKMLMDGKVPIVRAIWCIKVCPTAMDFIRTMAKTREGLSFDMHVHACALGRLSQSRSLAAGEIFSLDPTFAGSTVKVFTGVAFGSPWGGGAIRQSAED
mgnify:CR=1 FL=1